MKQTRAGFVLLLAGMVLLAGCGGATGQAERVLHSQKTILDTAVTFYQEGTEQADKAFRLEAVPVTDQQKSTISATLKQPENLTIDESGLLTYLDSTIRQDEDKEAMTENREEAIALAEGYLKDMGLLPPKSDYVAQAYSGTQTQGRSTESKIVRWTVNFYHTFGDVPIADEALEGIQITLYSGGIYSFTYRWSKVVPTGQAVPRTVTQAQDAIDRYAAHMEAANRGVPEVVVFRQVYIMVDGVAVPAWVFGDDEWNDNSVYVNAASGEIIKEYSYV